MTAHTPGPWHWEISDGDDYCLCDASGKIILDGWDNAGMEIPNEADKPLIKAAPDMLVLLRAVRAYHNGGAMYSIPAIDAAIAKAEGTS